MVLAPGFLSPTCSRTSSTLATDPIPAAFFAVEGLEILYVGLKFCQLLVDDRVRIRPRESKMQRNRTADLCRSQFECLSWGTRSSFHPTIDKKKVRLLRLLVLADWE